jgi:hypothetical protein
VRQATSSDSQRLKAYDRVVVRLFEKLRADSPDSARVPFAKSDLVAAVEDLGLARSILNIPDVVYTYRVGRSPLPDAVLKHGSWTITGIGKSRYVFARLTRAPYIDIPADLEVIPILDATPGIVLRYQKTDEQAVLARVRHNRLVDTFTGLTTYHLQGHFRTTVRSVGQVEIDDLYIGLNSDGESFILPVEGKAGSPRERIGVVQITQMVKFARQNFRGLPIRPIGIKVMPDDTLVFLEFNDENDSNRVATKRYRRYRLYHES